MNEEQKKEAKDKLYEKNYVALEEIASRGIWICQPCNEFSSNDADRICEIWSFDFRGHTNDAGGSECPHFAPSTSDDMGDEINLTEDDFKFLKDLSEQVWQINTSD